jgi:outer membrane lipoprotein SlyB
MTSSPFRLFLALLAAVAFAGCATDPGVSISGTGVVQSIQEVQRPNTGAQVVGTVGGALLGAWAGSQFGGGSGQTIASVAGGVGGSMAGSAVANRASVDTVFDVVIQFDDGITRVVRVDQRPNVRPGSRVSVSAGAISPL